MIMGSPKLIGSVYPGEHRYQWGEYARRVERINAERAKKNKKQEKE